jgi:hypothetical protein
MANGILKLIIDKDYNQLRNILAAIVATNTVNAISEDEYCPVVIYDLLFCPIMMVKPWRLS